MMAIHLVTEVARFYIVTSRSFSFSVEFASLVNLDIYCFSLSFFPCCISKVGCGSDLSRRIHEEIALRQMAHTLLLVSFIGCSLVAFTWKVLPLGFQRGPLKMVSNVFCSSVNVFVFCNFSDFSPLTSHFLTFACPGFITLHEFVNFYREDTLEGWQQSAAGPKKREQQTNADKLQLNIAFEFNFISIWRYSS